MADNPVDIMVNAITSLIQRECKSFLAGSLAARLASVENDSRFQYDPVARNIVAQVQKAAEENPNLVITAQQISNFYDEIESLNPETEFKSEYVELFPDSTVPEVEEYEVPREVDQARYEFVEYDREVGEPTLIVEEGQDESDYEVSEFEIGNTYEPGLHEFAEAGIKHELIQFGANNIRLRHKTNGPNMMVYVAQFTTPTGRHQVVVPVQVQNDLVILPEVFGKEDRSYDFSVTGFQKFERDNIRLAEIGAAQASDFLRHAESVDVSRNPSSIENFINNEEEVVEDDDLNLFNVGNSEGLEDIEAVLTNAIMRKNSNFSQRTISAAAEVLSRELRKVGQYKTPVFMGDGTHGDLLFETELQHNRRIASVTVPVETQGESVLFPTHFVSNNETYQLNSDGISSVFKNHPEQTVYDVASTDLTSATYNTLRQTIYAATMRHDYNRAQEALEVIASKFDKEAVTSAMKDYQDWIVQAQTAPVTDVSIQNGFGHRMSENDWAAALQREIKEVTGSSSIKIPEGLDVIQFEKYDDPGYTGTIMTNKIDGIELT